MSQQPEALRLVNEYRPTMPHDVLNSWAQDAKVMIARLTAENEALKAAVSEAVTAEREACAEIATDEDNIVDVPGYSAQLGDARATARKIEKAIRARGTP